MTNDRRRSLPLACFLALAALGTPALGARAALISDTHIIIGSGTLNSEEPVTLTIRATDQPGSFGEASIRKESSGSAIGVTLDCVVVSASQADRREVYASGKGSDGADYSIVINGFDALPWRSVHAGVGNRVVAGRPCGAAAPTYTTRQGWFAIAP